DGGRTASFLREQKCAAGGAGFPKGQGPDPGRLPPRSIPGNAAARAGLSPPAGQYPDRGRFEMMRRLFLILLLCLLPAGAMAHVVSESNSVWEINGADVDLIMTIPAVEAHRVTPNGPPPSDAVLKAYLTSRVYPLV